jgi:hypothetical protein
VSGRFENGDIVDLGQWDGIIFLLASGKSYVGNARDASDRA